MSDTAIENLRQAVKTAAASGPFALDAAFLTAGLNDPDVTTPADYDKYIQAAFQVAAANFMVAVSVADVGPVSGETFTVQNASIPFLTSSAPIQAKATLVFSVTTDATPTLVVQAQSAVANWTWTTSFAFMGGWPFNQLAVSNAQFVFSTADGTYPWTNSSGLAVKGGTFQNLFASVPFPKVVQPALTLFNNLQAPATLALQGALDLSSYSPESEDSPVLLPVGNLSATIQGGQFKLLYLTVANPSVMLEIPAPVATEEGVQEQAATLSVSSLIGVEGTPPEKSPYLLQIAVLLPSGGDTVGFSIALNATGEGSLLTPASVVDLVGGSGSYFTGTPAELQQFVASVGLQGLTVNGALGSTPTITEATVQIGSTGGSWTPIPNPPPGLDFTIESFSLQWGILNPFNSQTRQQSYLFEAEFQISQQIFPGTFEVQFNSALQLYAAYNGTVSLSNFLSGISNGVVSLPSSITASLSDIALNVDFNAKSFNFSSGFEFGVTSDFLSSGGYTILAVSGGQVSIGAMTPPESDGANGTGAVWQAGIGGLLQVGPLMANVNVAYDGTVTPKIWTLAASLAQPISLTDLVNQFFSAGLGYQFPPFLPGNLTINTFDIKATVPTSGTSTAYSVGVSFSWVFQLGGQNVGIDPASIELQYDGSKSVGQQFSGTVAATWVYSAINLELNFTYTFQGTGKGANQTLSLEWEGFTATYTSPANEVTFSLKGWSLGSLIQALVRTLGNPYFTLPSPWDLLNQISLDGLSVTVSLDSNVTNRLSAKYTLSSELNLGFVVIKSIIFRRDTNGKVTLAIDGSSPISSQLGDLMDPAKGQDVQKMPSVPGRGGEYFKLFLLVLGQRVGISGYASFNSTQEVIAALQKVPPTTGSLNPVNPGADPNESKGVPYYNQSNNWLVAAHLGLLAVGNVWTVDVMVVFNDPNLYGLRLALAGAKVGGLAGLVIDILYKKITDDIGLYQIEFTFPDAVRNLNFGAVSVTLPDIGIQIYTNGDFLIDIGFPYNLDFSRSFSIAAIVYGVPVLGSGGIYFGKLSSATSTQVPKTNNGTFDPVIVFGLGLQLGLGYNFTLGPLKAGFALTVFGIVEGVIASWHPYSGSSKSEVTALGTSLESDYYFKLSGTVGLIGLLYGTIDFAIIQASVNVKITLSVTLTYESYRSIPLTATATVDISVKVKIDLGLFSITFSFSFSATVSAKFVIGSDSTAPWDDQKSLQRAPALLRAHAGPAAVFRNVHALRPRLKRIRPRGMTAAAAKPQLKLLASPQFTVLAPEGATTYAAQQGAFSFLLAMDAPTISNPGDGNTSFDQLCAVFFPWVIDALGQPEGETVDLAAASATTVTREQLEAYIQKLADLASPPLNVTGLLTFLSDSFILSVETPAYAQSSGDKQRFVNGAVVFPVFDGLSLGIPNLSGGANPQPITFETYTLANSAYRQAVASIFESVEAAIEAQNEEKTPQLKAAIDDSESMAALIFVDYFSMIGRQLLQAARDLLDSYAYQLGTSESIQNILDTANAKGNTLQISDVAVPNQDHPLAPSLAISIPPLVYSIQNKDTLTGIATLFSDSNSPSRWTTQAADLIVANGPARILQPNVSLTISGKTYITIAGDSFDSVAAAFGISLTDLSQQTVLYGMDNLLAPAQQMSIPAIQYTTAPGSPASSDTLKSVAGLFATTVSELAAASATVPGLFSTAVEDGMITLANLNAWDVAGLWSSIKATSQVAQTAGMVSRFLMCGLRLPNETGLTLSSQFLFPVGQQAYALYQLTGQEFPTTAPQNIDDYTVTILAGASSHGVNLSFVQFNGAPGSSAQVDATTAYQNLSTVLSWARGGNFLPSPTFTALPPSLVQPQAFAAANFANWITSDMAGLSALTNRMSSSDAGTSSGQPLPTLWPLPSAMLSLTAARQSTLSKLSTSVQTILPLMPQFQPQMGQTSPATSQTDYTNLNNWAWTTRIDFQVKKLPVTGLSSGGAGDTPQGPASAPSLANVYEMVGASAEDQQTLELLLTAMDTLGEGIVSHIFLLYPQAGSSAAALATLGDSEFLAFLTQTNLSTETNPPQAMLRARAATGAPPRGIANAPNEFIKLLWELSTVRSGGYYLFYQVANGGDGLPASIFDSSGSATLSMVATFAAQGSNSFGLTAPAFVNSFVTTDSLDTASDVVQVVSQPTAGTSLPLTGAAGETLASLSVLYGAGSGALAAQNSSLALVSGKIIPVNNIVRQLVQADVTNPSQTLANLAAYYSVGAQSAISAQDIQNYNPGVQVALGTVFYIPQINYVVAPASTPGAAPGNTFGSMAAYYGLSLDAIAVDALNIGGLFPANSTLTINAQTFDLRSMLGPGNVNFDLTRVNYGPPSDNPSDPNYARNFMYSLYNTLSAGLMENAFFKASPQGAPFGPQVPDENSPSNETQSPTAFQSQARLASGRRKKLLAAEDEDYTYTQALGFGQFAKINAAPAVPGDSPLPPQSDNPYVGVGGTSQIALRWQDVFGNITITPFEAPPSGYTGALNGAAQRILYSDKLVPVSAWSNSRASYIYSGKAGAPTMNLTLTLDVKVYDGNLDQAARDLSLYQQIYFQLYQDYTDLGVPGITGNAVSMSLVNSILASPGITLSDSQASTIRNYVTSCVTYLQAVVSQSSSLPAQPTATLAMPVAITDVAAGNIISLDVELTFTRQALLTSPEVAALADGLSVSGTILPQGDVGQSSAYTTFATSFETAFQTSGWYMKVGDGLKVTGDQNGGTAAQLWAVRFGNSKDQGIYFEIGSAPSYYTPKPVATTLASKTVTINSYPGSEPVTMSFAGVDQNLWFQTCLDAIDTFLAPQYASSCFILDELLGTQDPLKNGYLGKVLEAKESLAASIGSAVRPILSTSSADSSTQWAAEQCLYQQLLNQIGSAYASGAVVIYGLNNVSGAPPWQPAGPPNLYGQPQGSVSSSGGSIPENQNFTFTATRIPLGEQADGSNTMDPRLAFVFTTKNIATQAYVPIDLNLQISHLEFDRANVAGIDGYVQSQWLAFVNGPFPYKLGTATADIPVVNRALPTPPTVQQQLATQAISSPQSPLDLTEWNYSFEYLYRFAAQDTVQTTIKLNQLSGTGLKAPLPGPDLFTALAQFTFAWPGISADFNEYLLKIDANSTDQTIINGATTAVSAFQQYFTAVADAYAASLQPNVAAFAAGAPQLVEIDFETSLDADPVSNYARTNILNLRINNAAATWDASANTISSGAITLPAPVVAIDPDNYIPDPVSPPVSPAVITWRYLKKGTGPGTGKPAEYLAYTDALENPNRTVSISGLDVLLYQNGWSSIAVERNKILFPIGSPTTTNPDFVFQTPNVSFADPVVPRLVYPSYPLDTGASQDLATLLNAFFAGLFTGGTGAVSVEVSMEAGYSYGIQPQLPRIALPVCLLPPTEAAVVSAPAPAFAAEIAGVVDQWITQQQPTTSGSAQLNFDLKVFGQSEKQPLLAVGDLFHNVPTGA
jgi:hypothetical protein